MASGGCFRPSGNVINDDEGTPNLVCNHVLGQTPGWSLKIETHEILACSNVHVALKIALPFSFPLAGERLTGKEF